MQKSATNHNHYRDVDMDGEWEPRMIDNPACAGISGCGDWKSPEINNPLYKGTWKAPMIGNPDYKVESLESLYSSHSITYSRTPSHFSSNHITHLHIATSLPLSLHGD